MKDCKWFSFFKSIQYSLKILFLIFLLLCYGTEIIKSQNDSDSGLKTFNLGLTTGAGGINRGVLPLPTFRLSIITIKTTIPVKYLSVSADCDFYKFKLPSYNYTDNSSVYLTVGYSEEYAPYYISPSSGFYETRYYGLIGVRRYSKGLFVLSFAMGGKYFETMEWDVDDETSPHYGNGWDFLAEFTLTMYFRKNFK